MEKICECGGTGYTIDLKSIAERIEGSNPSTRTKRKDPAVDRDIDLLYNTLIATRSKWK